MLRAKFSTELKAAMKSGDKIAVSTLRLIMAALKDRDIAKRSKGNSDCIGDDEILSLLQTMIKQRKDSVSMYEKAKRTELANREKEEIDIIQRFLPKQLTDDEIANAINSTIDDLNVSGLKDMGRIMASLKSDYTGQMDFGRASGIVKSKLSALT